MIVRQEATGSAVTSASYPGIADSVPEVRRLVRALFANSPRAYDLELITSELVTNAICHTPSGRKGGNFTVTIEYQPGRARLEVTDRGTSPWHPPPRGGDGVAQHGRGLQIVAELADEVGYSVTVGQRQATWAVLTWLPSLARSGSRKRLGASDDCAGSTHRPGWLWRSDVLRKGLMVSAIRNVLAGDCPCAGPDVRARAAGRDRAGQPVLHHR